MAFQIKDIFSRLYKITFDIFFYSSVLSILLGLLPDHFFNDFQIKPIQYDNDHLYKGLQNLQWNDDLVTKASFLGLNQLFGPESLADVGDYIYTGVLGGKLVRMHKSTEKIEVVARFNTSKECENKNSLKSGKCGRFLGLREHKDHLLVLEASTGLYRFDLKTNDLTHLSKNLILNEPAIYNDLVLDPKHPEIVYIAVSSSRWFLDRIPWMIIEHDQSGYVLAYNIKTGQSFKVSEGHAIANGIEITADQKYLLVCETSSYSVKKIELSHAREIFKNKKTLKADQLELFGDLLPGEVDNIRLDQATGDLLIGMFSVRPNSKVLRDYLAQWPFIRKSIARTAYALYMLLDHLDKNVISNQAIQQLRDDLYTGHILYKILPQRDGAVIRLDGKTGQFKQIYGSSKFFGVSEAIVDEKGDLYYGSFRNAFIGRIPKQAYQQKTK